METITKFCSRCKQEKPISDFYRSKDYHDGHQYYCKPCAKEENYKWRDRHPEKWQEIKSRTYRARWSVALLHAARSRSRKERWECNLTKEFIEKLFEKQNGRCPYFGVKMVQYSQHPRDPLKASLDRVNSKLGYTEDNVVMCCVGANFAKSSSSRSVFENFLRELKDASRA